MADLNFSRPKMEKSAIDLTNASQADLERKNFDLDLRLVGITRGQADILLMTVRTIIESWGATVGGGVLEVDDDEES